MFESLCSKLLSKLCILSTRNGKSPQRSSTVDLEGLVDLERGFIKRPRDIEDVFAEESKFLDYVRGE